MDNKIFSKFNLYDQIGYLLVGSIAILIVVFNLWLTGHALPYLNASNFIIWFILAYFVGHVVQAVANLCVPENKKDFSENEKKILKKAEEFFEISDSKQSSVYPLCYIFVASKDPTGQVEVFNALYGLYRGWFLTLTIEAIFLIIIFIKDFFVLNDLLFLLLALALAIIFFLRKKRFFQYCRDKTLHLFLLIYKGKI